MHTQLSHGTAEPLSGQKVEERGQSVGAASGLAPTNHDTSRFWEFLNVSSRWRGLFEPHSGQPTKGKTLHSYIPVQTSRSRFTVLKIGTIHVFYCITTLLQVNLQNTGVFFSHNSTYFSFVKQQITLSQPWHLWSCYHDSLEIKTSFLPASKWLEKT